MNKPFNQDPRISEIINEKKIFEIFWQYRVPCVKKLNKRSKKLYIRKTANHLFKKFREKKEEHFRILSLYFQKQNIKMVTQRQMNSLKRRLNAVNKEVADMLTENGKIKEENVGVFIVSNEIMKALLLKQTNY